jgi:hypothetical protein
MRRFHVLFLALLPAVAACAAGSVPAPAAPVAATDAEWQALLLPRPTPLAGARRVSVGTLALGEERWGMSATVPPAVTMQELIGVGLMRRADVQYVERRRFAEAAERERRGLPRPRGAPEVGTSPGVELLLTGTMSPLLGDSAYIDLRLIDPATGTARTAWRVGIPRGADPTAIARRVVGSVVATLDSLDALPAWTDPVADAAPVALRGSGVPATAADAFARGVAAEDTYDWEAARRAYQRARELGGTGFFEPDVALTRVARLRAGGTLGAS